jgi:phosphatidylserine/phosphatidylglycerophosphate/cardiolipin synthase-like enzyme
LAGSHGFSAAVPWSRFSPQGTTSPKTGDQSGEEIRCPDPSSFCPTIRPGPLLVAIANAVKSIRIKMFLFSDPSLLQAVIDAQHRGVDVRIMLNPERRDGEKENANTRKKLTDAGVHVIDSNPQFDATHEKSMVIDDETAFVQSLNWETKNLGDEKTSLSPALRHRNSHKHDLLFGSCGETTPRHKADALMK